MKIERVTVFDPRDYGLMERPILTFVIDEELHDTSQAVVMHGGKMETWSSRKAGPFIRYNLDLHPSLNIEPSAGLYNRVYAGRLPPIVDVRIFVRYPGGGLLQQEGNFGTTLQRARQFMRKYDVPWRLLMNDHDGQEGITSWTPVPRVIRCKFMICKSDDQTCEDPAVQSVYTEGIDMPMCEEHLQLFNETQKNARQSSR